MNRDVAKTLKLTSADLANIAERLQNLSETNDDISTIAYLGDANSGSRCGCKGSCDGGCTSW